MSNILYIILGVGLGTLLAFVIFFIARRSSNKFRHPSVLRAENMIVMLNQRILSLNSRIDNLDTETTRLLAAKEKADLSILKMEIALEDIPERIEANKTDINTYIADIKDLQEYKNEIKAILKSKGEVDLKKLEELLEFVKEKFQYRYT